MTAHGQDFVRVSARAVRRQSHVVTDGSARRLQSQQPDAQQHNMRCELIYVRVLNV